MKLFSLLALALVSVSAQAAEVGQCYGLDKIDYLVGNVKSYANGAIRVAHVDTYGEPACCSSHLVIYVAEEPMGATCFAVSQNAAKNENEGALGFMSLNADRITSKYDARRGLELTVPVSYYNETGEGTPGTVKVLVDRSSGEGKVTIVR